MVDAAKSTQFTGERRYLSIGETFQEYGNQCAPPLSNFFHVTVFSSTQPVPQDIVKESLSALISRHVLLKSEISADKNQDFFFEANKESLGDKLFPLRFEKVKERNGWVPVINKELERGCNELLWKAVWLEVLSESEQHEYVLVFTCSHAVLDGKGGFDIIANQFTGICNTLLNHSQIDLLQRPIFCVKSMEDIFMNMTLPVSQQPVNWFIKAAANFGLWLGNKLSGKPKLRTHEVCQEANNCHEYHSFIVDEKMTGNFISSCKKNSVSIHSALLVLTSCVLETTRASYSEFKDKINAFVYPIDLRKFVNELCTSPMPCGTYFSAGSQTIQPFDVGNKTKFFDISRKVNEKVKQQNKSTMSSLMWSSLTAFLRNSTLTFPEKLACLGMNSSVSVSNIGNCDVALETNNQSPLRVEEHYLGVAIPGGFFVGTSTIRNQMCFCLAYSGKWITKEFVVDFSKNFVKAIQEVSG